MDSNDGVWVAIANSPPSVVVEFLEAVGIEHGAERFIEKLDGSNDIGGTSISLRKRLESIQSVLYIVALLPSDISAATTVIKTVLGTGGW